MNKNKISFSIIIPFKKVNPDLLECLEHIQRLTKPAKEIILLPDQEIELNQFPQLNIKIKPTGAVSPALKRDQGAQLAQGKYLAFIDDDAYPQRDWLEVAFCFLKDNPQVGAIGGPAITPPGDPFGARVSGAVFLSKFSGGFPERYRPIPPRKKISDWPSVNLIVNKKAFFEVGGFNSRFWPGEDTKLCRDLILRGYDLYYLPEMIVFHHRRATLKKHFRQVGQYGFHRGLFARIYPQTSRKISFFLPSAFLIFVISSLLLVPFSPLLCKPIAFGYLLYAFALGISFAQINRFESTLVAILSLPLTVATHLVYGLRFLTGFFSITYKESLGR